ncbi:hypothetical protein EPA93_40700 [Ktedonosporobacter rubrisoli]|uniref:Uncharacterized protein n=1 Tax=Ktedonosporobacter rubrisoli TaxID=2509675 RepID=A0A4P6K1K5_KTERU|nr:DmsC/YnfH family molybdoenzyme membrane anchor subunit [Ktedonosporobacter rubrisoli]QBD81964.1 hypothetical protein EPA93_40700 [Ktedonosporobacter rubrisoli]
MLQTLPLVLFIIMTEVSIGSVSVLVFLDWRREVKRGFLVSYALIYLGLAGLTYLFQQNFSTAALLNTYAQLDKTWTGYQALPLLLFFLLLIPYNVFLWLDKGAGVEEKKAVTEEAQAPAKKAGSTLRLLRLISGVATVVAGLVTLFVMAMIYRPLAAANLGGIFTVASFFAAAFALGGVMTAMWLGHWYLVTPALSGRPLQFATTIVLVAILAQVIFAVSAGPSTAYANNATAPVTNSTAVSTTDHGKSSVVKPADAPTIAPPISADAMGWLRILVGFAMPLVLGGLAWKLIRDRSFQSATGMLYLVVVLSLAGEIMARGLFLSGL